MEEARVEEIRVEKVRVEGRDIINEQNGASAGVHTNQKARPIL